MLEPDIFAKALRIDFVEDRACLLDQPGQLVILKEVPAIEGM